MVKNKLISDNNLNEIILKTNNLSKKFGKNLVVKNLNLEVHKGETIGFFGPNGAGKTTTIKLIAKLLRPTTGNILIKNKRNNLQDISVNSQDLISMGFLIEIPVFYDSNPNILLKHYAKLHSYPKEKINQRIDELLSYFNLINWKKKKELKTFLRA